MNAPNKPIVCAALPPLELRTVEEIMEWLKNPQVVYQSMLRGVIAPISMDLLANIHGEEMAVRWQAFVESEKVREAAIDCAANPPPYPHAPLTHEGALRVIAAWPITEPANMDAMNMRAVARAAQAPATPSGPINFPKEFCIQAAKDEEEGNACWDVGAAPPNIEAVASIYVSPTGEREMDDWKVPLPEGSTTLYRLNKASK